MSEPLTYLSDCKDEELVELRERNAKLVAALKEARKRLIGCGTHGIYAGVLTQIDEALGRQ